MHKHIATLWTNALRSEEYEQGSHQLTYFASGEDGLQHVRKDCCLGVLCDLALKSGEVEGLRVHETNGSISYDWTEQDEFTGTNVVHNEGIVLPKPVADWAGIRQGVNPDFVDDDGNVHSLAFKNDHGATFEEIADLIEKHVEDL